MVTPLSIGLDPDPDLRSKIPSQFVRATARKNLLESLHQVDRDIEAAKKEEQKVDELRQKRKQAEKELQEFYDQQLEVVQAGGPPLLTCRHCHYLFSCYQTFAKHRCQFVRREEDGDVPHFRVVEGRDREAFLHGLERLSPRRQVQVCVATRTACRGVYPLVFPERGNSSLSMLEEVVCVGEAAYSTLYDAVRDGELWLPEKLVLDLPLGGELFLPPSLLTPHPAVKRAKLDISLEEDGFLLVDLAKVQPVQEEDDDDDALPAEATDKPEDSDDEEDGGDGWWESVEGGGPDQEAQATAPPPQAAVPPAALPPLRPGAPTLQDRQVLIH